MQELFLASPLYTTAYEYDIAGNVVKETDVNGNSKTYTYDGLGKQYLFGY